MRRQDGADEERGERRLDPTLADTGPAQERDRRREGIVRRGAGRTGRAPTAGRLLSRALRPAGLADPLALLGKVDEPEVETERADDDLGAVRLEAGELRDELAAERRVVATAEPDRRSPNALDEIEEIATRLLGDHLPEERAEQPDLQAERVAGTPGADRRRLAANGLVGSAGPDAVAHAAANGLALSRPFRSAAGRVPQPSDVATARRLVS